jgi:hypothetical protein
MTLQHTLPLSVSTCLLLATTTLNAAPLPLSAYRYQRTLGIASTQEEIAAAPLDAATWSVVQPQASDLRIADTTDTAIPHLLRRATAKRVRRIASSCHAKTDALRERPDNALELDLTIPEDKPPADTLTLSTPLRNFERRISIAGIQPDGTTTQLVADALIYDYTRFMDMRHLKVEIPRNDFHRLRVTIHAVTDTGIFPETEITRTIRDGKETERTETTDTVIRPFRIDKAELLVHRDQTSNREAITIDYTHLTWTQETDSKENTTTYLIAVSNAPLTGLTIATPERNFSRRATIEAPFLRDGRTQWRQIASATLSQVSFRSFSQETLALSFPEQAHKELRLILHNGDAAPLALETITGQGPQWEALFIATPDESYRLLAGSDVAKAPTFNTNHLEKLLAREIKPLACDVGPLLPNPTYNAKSGRSMLSWLGSKTLFGAGIVVVIAILAAGLVRAGKSALEAQPPT